MKTEFTDVSETRKHLAFEIPSETVEAEIDRVAKGYSRSARVPGFRPGKVPAGVVRQRYKEQILYDVAHDLIPRVVGDALRERGLRPVATPDIRDVVLEEGQPLTFIADFETMPDVEPGEYTGITVRRHPAVLEVGAIDHALEHLQQRAARWHPVEDRPAAEGDTVLLNLVRTRRSRLLAMPGEAAPPPPHADDDKPEQLVDVAVEIGNKKNPPGFDENLIGLAPGQNKTFTTLYPPNFGVEELQGVTMEHAVTVKGIRRRELLPLDDEFAKEVSDLETLDALRLRIKDDLQREAERESDHRVRHDLLRELAMRVKTVPDVLIEHEIDRRLEEFVRRLMEQGIDPEKAGIDWQEFRQRQREPALETVRSTIMLDEIARREGIDTTDEDVEQEIARFAERSGRTPTAVRATLEKDGAIERIRSGIRREKAMAWLVEKANVVAA
jgi:trigger factor